MDRLVATTQPLRSLFRNRRPRLTMKTNTYSDLLEPWQLKLIKRCAPRMGFRGADLDDARQHIAYAISTFKFVPQRSNGATRRTALTAVIKRQLTALTRARIRADRRTQRIIAMKQQQDWGRESARDVQALRLDVQLAIETLPASEQAVCRMLEQGATRADIARELGCTWSKVDTTLKRLRRRFEDLGLHEWLND
jgi:DNA-directed RNA polymerase specialized sigma24 family protein